MKALNNFQAVVTSLGVAIGVVLSKAGTEWISTQPLGKPLSLLISLAVIAVAYLGFRFGSEKLVSSCRPLRRFLLRRQFVEGTWLEIVTSGGGEQLVGKPYIGFSSSSLTFTGQNFLPNGKPHGAFHGDMVVLDWPILKYEYTWTRHTTPKHSTTGYGEIHFDERDSYPVSYQGFFVDIEDALRYDVLGWRVENEEDLASLADPEKRERAISRLAANHLAAAPAEEQYKDK